LQVFLLVSFRIERELLLEYASALPGLHTVQKRSNAANRRTVSRIAHSAGYSIGFIIFKRMASLESKPSFR